VVKKVVKKTAAKKITHNIRTSYLGAIFGGDYSKHVDAAVKTLKDFKKKTSFDAIAFTGTSGAGIAFPLSYFLKLPLLHIPKSGVYRHSANSLEGTVNSKKYVIVDDFIASGDTVRRIERTISTQTTAKPVAIFLFASRGLPNYSLGLHKVPVIVLPTPGSYDAPVYKT
jgi:adenine/guanine phosphoribosyltransferase-like PRPP-binding protein